MLGKYEMVCTPDNVSYRCFLTRQKNKKYYMGSEMLFLQKNYCKKTNRPLEKVRAIALRRYAQIQHTYRARS
jgi:hypothetical protein